MARKPPDRAQDGRAAMSTPTLERTIFKTSRLAEFCSRKELINQTGHDVGEWPLAVSRNLSITRSTLAKRRASRPSLT